MSSEFLEVQRDLEEASRPRPSHPNGWEPGVDTAKGVVVTVAEGSSPPTDWSSIIAEFGLDTSAWTVDESYPVQVRTWDVGAKRAYYYRATVVPTAKVVSRDVDELISRVRKHRKKSPANVGGKPRALVVCLADWQAGKSEGGGYEALVERVESLREAVPARVRQLKKAGVAVDRLYIVGMGDLVEGCGNNHYASQDFNLQLDRRQQVKLVRRLLLDCVTHWSTLAPKLVLAAVPGNHGENRRAGKTFTTFEDNDDVAVVEQVAEILAANNDAYGHVRVMLADGDMTLTLDVAGTIVAFAHGHQAGGGSSGVPAQKIKNWWKDKAVARHPVGDADVLVTGHYHHLTVVQDGPRTHLQCPANDGGSRWFEEQGGSTTLCGTLTFVVDDGGWSNLEVLR